MSAKLELLWFLSLKKNNFETRKNAINFTSKALFCF